MKEPEVLRTFDNFLSGRLSYINTGSMYHYSITSTDMQEILQYVQSLKSEIAVLEDKMQKPGLYLNM